MTGNAPIFLYEHEQRSVEWHRLRFIPTASYFHRIYTPVKGERTSEKQWKDYRNYLIACRLLKQAIKDKPWDEGEEPYWMNRGIELEPDAVRLFEALYGIKTKPISFVMTPDQELGCSPDRVTLDEKQAVEIKCLHPRKIVGLHLDGMPKDFRPQVQGQLYIGQFEIVHFFAYHPDLKPFYHPTTPDPDYQLGLKDALYWFIDQVREGEAKARADGIVASDVGEFFGRELEAMSRGA